MVVPALVLVAPVGFAGAIHWHKRQAHRPVRQSERQDVTHRNGWA
jgi:hypothetical protein